MLTASIKYPVQKVLQIILPLLMLSAGMNGQSFILTKYTSKDGLAHDNVRDIAVDSSGFLWLATWDGLTRYDGTEFRNYYHNPEDSTTIPYFSVSRVVVDSRDNLWLTTDNRQLSLLDRATDKFRTINAIDNHPVKDLINIEPGPDRCIYIVLSGGVLIFNPEDSKVRSFVWAGEMADSMRLRFGEYRILFDRERRLWLAGHDIIELLLQPDDSYGNGKALVRSINMIERKPGRTGVFYEETGSSRITYDLSGNMWVASRTGLFIYEKEGNRFREYSGKKGNLSFADSLPVMYYDKGEGLNIWLPSRDSVLTITEDESGMPMLMFIYDKSLLWLSCQTIGGTPAGICKVIITPFSFTHLDPVPEKNNPPNVFAITGDSRGNLWVAARNRNYLMRMNRNGTVDRINTLTGSEEKRLWHPRAFLPDTNCLWIGYYFEDLIRYDLTTERIRSYNLFTEAHTICFDGEGRILVGDRGIVRFDPATGASERLMAISDTAGIYTFYRDDSVLWAGCNYSYLLKYNLNTGKTSLIRLLNGITNIEAICPGDNGELWLALLGSGVCRFDPATGARTFYTTSAGLSNNTTYGILKDRTGKIWVSTNQGISVINPENGLIRSFGPNDGLMIHEFNSDAAYDAGDGTFYFGGVGGLVRFNPEQLLNAHTGNKQNKILITYLEVSAARRLLPEPVYKTDTITLEKGEDNFHLSFIVPEYRYPEKIRYRYRLGDEPENWYLTTYKDRNINYSNLKPGIYKLEIQATDMNGSWTNSRILIIKVKPYFYQTKFFIVAAPSAVLILIFLVAYILFRQYRTREMHKRETLRHQALRAQMNPHFIFNALNSINYFISRNDRMSANRFISDFSKLIRTTLSNMNEEFVRLGTELESVEEYLKIEHLRFGDRFDYVISIDPVIVPDTVNVSPGLVQPFVENAIWHGIMGLEGRKGMIRVLFCMRNNTLTCTVEDDGIGRKRSEAMKDVNNNKKSRGIALAAERMKLINSIQSTAFRIRITDLYPERKDTGTRVEIEMPVQKS